MNKLQGSERAQMAVKTFAIFGLMCFAVFLGEILVRPIEYLWVIWGSFGIIAFLIIMGIKGIYLKPIVEDKTDYEEDEKEKKEGN